MASKRQENLKYWKSHLSRVQVGDKVTLYTDNSITLCGVFVERIERDVLTVRPFGLESAAIRNFDVDSGCGVSVWKSA